MTVSNAMTTSCETDDGRIPVFEVEYGCGNCGATFERQYERNMHITDKGNGSYVNDDSTFESASKVTCPICDLTKSVDVRERSPIDVEER
jgi:hypothetical protein